MTARTHWFIALVIVLGLAWGGPVNAGPQEPKPTAEPAQVKPPLPPQPGTDGKGSEPPGRPDQVVAGLNGQQGGLSIAVTKRSSDHYVYLGQGPRMLVIDVANPALPVIVGRSVVLTATVRWIQTEPSWAYVLDNSQLRVFDVGSPDLPTLISSTPLPGAVGNGVFSPTVSGRWVWAATGSSGGVTAIDVTNRAAPIVRTTLNLVGQPQALARSGNFLYVANGTTGMKIVDVSNPGVPSARGGVGGDPSASFLSVAVYGNYAYVGTSLNRFRIIDVSNPDAPVAKGYIDLPKHGPFYGVYGIYIVNGATAYVAADGAGIYAVNVQNPDAPQVIGGYDTPGRARGIWVSSNYAYEADWYGMRVFDVSNPAPAPVANLPALGRSMSVGVQGNYAYVADADFGTRVVSFANLAAPEVVGSYNAITTTADIASASHYAYVAAKFNGLQVLDVTDPAAPVRCGFYTNPQMYANSVAVSGDYAYVADILGFLRVIRVNPCSGVLPLMGQASISGATGVTVNGQYAYVAAGNSGLVTVNIANPSSPYVVSTYNPPVGGSPWALNVSVLNTTAFLVLDTAGLVKIDVSNPSNPSLLASASTIASMQDVMAYGNRVYVAEGSKGLHVYTADTLQLAGLVSWDSAGQAYGVIARTNPNGTGDQVFLADEAGGLDILQVSGVPPLGSLLLPIIRRSP